MHKSGKKFINFNLELVVKQSFCSKDTKFKHKNALDMRQRRASVIKSTFFLIL